MDQDTEALKADIERRRNDIGETLDAIGDRVSPGRMVERQRNRMGNGVRSVRDRVMGTFESGGSALAGAGSTITDTASPENVRSQVSGHPLGAGLVTFGIGFLVAAAMPPSEAEESAAATLKEKAEPVTSQLAEAGREVAGSLKEEASEAASEVKGAASEAATQVSEAAKQQASDTKEQLKPSGG